MPVTQHLQLLIINFAHDRAKTRNYYTIVKYQKTKTNVGQYMRRRLFVKRLIASMHSSNNFTDPNKLTKSADEMLLNLHVCAYHSRNASLLSESLPDGGHGPMSIFGPKS